MSEEFWFLFAGGLGVAMAMMVAVWIFARAINNASVVDVAWSLGFALLTGLYAALGNGAPGRKLLITAMVCAWSLRLGAYLWIRVAKHHPSEDGRYATLRAQFPSATWLMFFGFFQLQAVLLAVLSVPFLLASVNGSPAIRPIEWFGAALWLVAVGGEATADAQLHRFRSNPANAGRVCAAGLWRVSRHPNYFFEWLVWVAYFVFALGSPFGWIAVYCPLVMLYFLVRVTGIPATEEQALKSRGEAYAQYQRETSAFVPWLPRRRRR